MIRAIILCLALCLPAICQAAEATFTWTANTESYLLGYRIVQITQSTGRQVEYDHLCGPGMQFCCEKTIIGLRTGTEYCFWAIAIGKESDKEFAISEPSDKVCLVAR